MRYGKLVLSYYLQNAAREENALVANQVFSIHVTISFPIPGASIVVQLSVECLYTSYQAETPEIVILQISNILQEFIKRLEISHSVSYVPRITQTPSGFKNK